MNELAKTFVAAVATAVGLSVASGRAGGRFEIVPASQRRIARRRMA